MIIQSVVINQRVHLLNLLLITCSSQMNPQVFKLFDMFSDSFNQVKNTFFLGNQS